jgi:Spy/CpxP family protein refolding chaperone
MGGGERMTDRLFNGITLTGAQRDSIDKLSAAHAAQTRQAWQSRQGGGGPPDSAARAQMQADRAQYLATLRAVLTPDQQPAFDKNVADMQSQMGRRGGGGGGNP